MAPLAGSAMLAFTNRLISILPGGRGESAVGRSPLRRFTTMEPVWFRSSISVGTFSGNNVKTSTCHKLSAICTFVDRLFILSGVFLRNFRPAFLTRRKSVEITCFNMLLYQLIRWRTSRYLSFKASPNCVPVIMFSLFFFSFFNLSALFKSTSMLSSSSSCHAVVGAFVGLVSMVNCETIECGQLNT